MSESPEALHHGNDDITRNPNQLDELIRIQERVSLASTAMPK